MKWLLSRLTIEDFIALVYLSRHGPLTFEQLQEICLKADIYCDITYLSQLGLARKKKDVYKATKKVEKLLKLFSELLNLETERARL